MKEFNAEKGKEVESYLSVSEMAQLHNISRQTLIYYDKIGLLKPHHIDEHGYRYYSPYQIPYLREICILKAAGIKLEDIKRNISDRDVDNVTSLLVHQKDDIENEINTLIEKKKFIEHRLDRYSKIISDRKEIHKPKIEKLPHRKMVFLPYENEITRDQLHLNMIKTWKVLTKDKLFYYGEFGTLIKKENLNKKNVFEGSGICFFLPEVENAVDNIKEVPGGEYVCMYKYGMPYEPECLFFLTSWVKDNGYEITGDIIDICLLDSTFYEHDRTVDFCQLQIPVKKII